MRQSPFWMPIGGPSRTPIDIFLHGRQRPKRGGRRASPRGITRRDHPAGPYHTQHPRFERRARFRRREHLLLKAGVEAVDQNARRPAAGQFHGGRWSKLDERPERHPLKVQTGSGDVLAELSRSYLEARVREGGKELGRDQVDLPEIGQAWPAAGEIAVPDEWAGVGVA